MSFSISLPNSSKIDIRLWFKLIIYTLLLVNFALYFQDDWVNAQHTMRNGGSFLDWTGAFATTIDESAWMFLLILFELETYVLSDEPLSRPKAFLMHAVRVVCYVSLAHTLYAYSDYLIDLRSVPPIEDITNLCQLAGNNLSHVYNLHYTEISSVNCQTLSTATQFFYTDPPEFLIVADSAGLALEKGLALVDIIEAVTWLLILLSIEINVWIQDRGIASGLPMTILKSSKTLLYLILWGAIAYWLYYEHWMFAWDEFVWIAGFIVIEMNMAQWRKELLEAENTEHSAVQAV